MAIEHELRDAIVDCTITDTSTGKEIDDVSECYLALAQQLDGTLNRAGLTIEWGPCETRRKQAVSQAPHWVWEAALDGRLCLEGNRVSVADASKTEVA